MTTTCMCGNVFGLWRPRCPACGTAVPEKVRAFNERLADSLRNPAPARRRRKEPRARAVLSKTLCKFCTLRGAKHNCPDCGVLVHRTCLGLHKEQAHP